MPKLKKVYLCSACGDCGFGTRYNAPLIIEIKHMGLIYLEYVIALNIRVNNYLCTNFR